MNKFTLCLIFAVLTIFISADLVSAGNDHNKGKRGLNGEYAMSATGSCLNSPSGFTVNAKGYYSPVDKSTAWSTTSQAEGIWTFNNNGTGTIEGTNYNIDSPPGDVVIYGGPIARHGKFSFKFDYDLKQNGKIYVTANGLPFQLNIEGMVSKDRKTMTLISTYQDIFGIVVCNYTRVLIKIH